LELFENVAGVRF